MLAASVFHFGIIGNPEMKEYLRERNVSIMYTCRTDLIESRIDSREKLVAVVDAANVNAARLLSML